MAKRRGDWELSGVELSKRMSRWKDRTLANKLKKLGVPLSDFGYSERSAKNISKGQQRIGATKRRQMQKKYEELMKNFEPPSKWLTVEAWINAIPDPSLQREFSIIRLQDRGLYYVYLNGGAVVFTNKLVKDKPKQPEATQQYVVYQITVEDDQEIESWIQVSADFYYGADPTSTAARTAAAASVAAMQERNEAMKNLPLKSNEFYTWWSHNAKEATYAFIGIGVIL